MNSYSKINEWQNRDKHLTRVKKKKYGEEYELYLKKTHRWFGSIK